MHQGARLIRANLAQVRQLLPVQAADAQLRVIPGHVRMRPGLEGQPLPIGAQHRGGDEVAVTIEHMALVPVFALHLPWQLHKSIVRLTAAAMILAHADQALALRVDHHVRITQACGEGAWRDRYRLFTNARYVVKGGALIESLPVDALVAEMAVPDSVVVE